MMEIQLIQVGAAILFFAGIAAVASTRNMIKTVMGFQVCLFGVNLALFAGGVAGGASSLFSRALVVLSIAMGASVEALALSLVIYIYRTYHTLDPWELRRLKH